MSLCYAAGGVLLGGAISSVQLVPFVADLAAINLEGRDFSAAHPPGGYILTTVAPHVWGSCVDGAVTGPLNPIESTAFVGAGAVILAIAAIAARRRLTQAVSFRLLFAILVAVIAVAMWVGFRGPIRDDSLGHVALYVMPAIRVTSFLIGWVTWVATTALSTLYDGVEVTGWSGGWYAALIWGLISAMLLLGSRWPNPRPPLPRPLPEVEADRE